MRVLVLGSTGFIGLAAAQALSRSGHQVYGLVRDEGKVKFLAMNEIIPVLGDVTKSAAWIHLIATIDVVIDALGGPDVINVQDAAFQAVRSAAASRIPGASKISYIYTSGTFVHGKNGAMGEYITDTTPLVNPMEVVSWRPAKEQVVLKDDILSGIVVRPTYLYGKRESGVELMFKTAAAGRVRWPGRPGGRIVLIHVDDLADLYVRVAERAPILGGLTIDAANSYVESVDDILKELTRVSGAQGPPELYEPTNALEEAFASTALLKPYLARSLLDWQPRKPGLAEGAELYWNAYKASQ